MAATRLQHAHQHLSTRFHGGVQLHGLGSGEGKRHLQEKEARFEDRLTSDGGLRHSSTVNPSARRPAYTRKAQQEQVAHLGARRVFCHFAEHLQGEVLGMRPAGTRCNLSRGKRDGDTVASQQRATS